MKSLATSRVHALHPHWTSDLVLDRAAQTVLHVALKSGGRFREEGQSLIVDWDAGGKDVFVRHDGLFLHTTLAGSLPALDKIYLVSHRERVLRASSMNVVIPGTGYDVRLRLHTSDLPTFDQVFMDLEYDAVHLPAQADTIIDLGANIGLATVFFGLRYPNARILGIEPEAENFRVLEDNTRAMGDRVMLKQGAVWTHDGTVNLRTSDDNEQSRDSWAFQVSNEAGADELLTPSYTMSRLLDLAGFETVDILKMDIEGAELEVFSQGKLDWLPRVKLLILEVHDWFRPGCAAAVRKGLGADFQQLSSKGENWYFLNRNQALVSA